MDEVDGGKAERIRTYRTFCADIEAMSAELAGMGNLIVAAYLQAALDLLRQEVVAAEGSI